MKEILWGVIVGFFLMGITVFSSQTNDTQPIILEVGFSQNNSPEPYFVLLFSDQKTLLYEISESQQQITKQQNHRGLASLTEKTKETNLDPLRTLAKLAGVEVPHQSFQAHLNELQNIPTVKLNNKQCADKYILRVIQNGIISEHTGCESNHQDPFAEFAHKLYKDAFMHAKKLH